MFLPLKPFKQAKADFARAYLQTALRATRGDVAAAARIAGHNRTQFYMCLARAEVNPAGFRPDVASADALAQRARRARRRERARLAWLHPVGASAGEGR